MRHVRLKVNLFLEYLVGEGNRHFKDMTLSM